MTAADLMIAATALEHGLQGTRKTFAHISPQGVQC